MAIIEKISFTIMLNYKLEMISIGEGDSPLRDQNIPSHFFSE